MTPLQRRVAAAAEMVVLWCVAVTLRAETSRLDQAFTPLNFPGETAVEVRAVNSNALLYRSATTSPQASASLAKLVVAAAALLQWGGQHQFATRFILEPRTTLPLGGGGHVNTLFAVGGGDPYLTDENLYNAARQLFIHGLRRVDHLVIDQSLYRGTKGSFRRYSEHAYNAAVTPLMVNFNTFATYARPAARQEAEIGLFPFPLEELTLNNRVQVAANGKRLHVSRHGAYPGPVALTLTGTLAPDSDLQFFYRSMGYPDLEVGLVLRGHLIRAGIDVGDVTEGRAPPTGVELYLHQGRPLSEVIQGMNVYSNNMIADSLVHNLGVGQAVPVPDPGTYSLGLRRIHTVVRRELGINLGTEFHSGSGLDPSTRIQAGVLTQLLVAVAKRWGIGPEFVTSLPVGAVSGTLKERFAGWERKSPVRAKTGTITQPLTISGLAGYIDTPTFGQVAFTIIYNTTRGRPYPIAELQRTQERGLNALAQHLRQHTKEHREF